MHGQIGQLGRTNRWRHGTRSRARALQERDPSLIDLPVPVPSIPILEPLVSPLIGGLPWPSTTSSQASSTAPAAPTSSTDVQPASTTLSTTQAAEPTTSVSQAASDPASSPTSPSSSGSGGGQGASSNGFGEGQGASGGSSGGSAPAESGGGDSGDATGGGGGESSSRVSPGTNPAGGSSGSVAAASRGASAGSSAQALASSSPTPAPALASTQTTSQGPSGQTPSSASGASGPPSESASASATAVPMGVENAYSGGPGDSADGSVAASSASSTGGLAASTSAAVVSVSSGQPGSGSSGSGGGSPSASTSSAISQSRLSGGQIAAIAVVLVLLFLLLIFVVLRRRSLKRRLRRRKNWLFFCGRSSVYGHAAISSSGYFTDHPDDGSASSPAHVHWEAVGNSSGTGSTVSHLDLGVPRQMQGKMQQVWTSHLNGSMVFAPSLAALASKDKDPLPTIRSVDRASWSSTETDSDETPTETRQSWLRRPGSVVVNGRSSPLPSLMAMSARPFSPSEAWQLPQPPDSTVQVVPNDDDGGGGRRSRAARAVSSRPDSTLESGQSTEYGTAPEDPFSDDNSAEADAVTAASAGTETASHFARIETIRRPFVPAIEDEMAVEPGERVRILKRFDDGWACAETIDTDTRRRGIIPIDCLRPPEADPPAFLASKRLSSYRPPGLPGPEETGDQSTAGKAV